MSRFAYPSSSNTGKESQRFLAPNGLILTPRSTTIQTQGQSQTPRGSIQVSSQLPTPRANAQTANTTKDKTANANVQRRGTDREKKWKLRAWETEYPDDDGIVGWTKRQNMLDSKKDLTGKKRPAALDDEHFIPIKNKCSAIDDEVSFRKESLHKQFLPKEKIQNNKPTTQYQSVPTLHYTYTTPAQLGGGDTVGVVTATGFEERIQFPSKDKDPAQENIDTYRSSKSDGILHGHRRSNSVPEQFHKNIHGKEYNRSNTYHQIRRLLKFKDGRRHRRFEDEDDEGYSSKTSSAETKAPEVESDGEDTPEESNLNKSRQFSSMINLSELPSNSFIYNENEKTYGVPPEMDNSKIKFNYTHQPAILQLPDPNIKLNHDKVRLGKKVEAEDAHSFYAKLKRSKELNKCHPMPITPEPPMQEDPMKPVTLVLRKISIQNADNTKGQVVPPGNSNNQSRDGVMSRNSSLSGSRIGSALSRAGSAVSRTSSVMSQTNSSRLLNRPKSHHSKSLNINSSNLSNSTNSNHSNNTNNHINHSSQMWEAQPPPQQTFKESMWSQQYSVMERQATSYCIGDLLPAVDKNIYVNPYGKGRLQYNEDTTAPNLSFHHTHASGTSADDGYILLKKGMDLLTGGVDKSTLGPPPFRPNQTRHPLIRNVTVVINSKQDTDTSPINHTGLPKRKSPTLRVSSDKGPRPKQNQANMEKETQKKLKEAFTKFYENRPKEIGKEFRRMQTMWKT